MSEAVLLGCLGCCCDDDAGRFVELKLNLKLNEMDVQFLSSFLLEATVGYRNRSITSQDVGCLTPGVIAVPSVLEQVFNAWVAPFDLVVVVVPRRVCVVCAVGHM